MKKLELIAVKSLNLKGLEALMGQETVYGGRIILKWA
jgi:hypothetical protein